MRRISALLFSLVLAAPLASSALTLQDLNAGASFTNTGGQLTFEFAAGSIALSGALPADLAQYTVLPTASGFIVSGPLGVLGPAAFGALTLAYRVVAGAGLELTSALLQGSGLAFGSGAFAVASSGLSNGAGFGILLTQGGGTGTTAGASFGGVSFLDALANVQLFALLPGDMASLGSVQHGYGWVAVPEPAASLTLAAGLVGLALLGRRRTGGPSATA
jgi:hypothetical protein